MVKLTELKTPSERYDFYVNASYINVSDFFNHNSFLLILVVLTNIQAYKLNQFFVQSNINNEKERKAFIAAMAPSTHTVESFWQMMLENNVSLAIMLCPETEKEKEMCIKYYEPKELSGDQPNQTFKFGDISITVKSKKEVFPGMLVRKLLVSKSNRPAKKVTHIQELLWEDNSRPDNAKVESSGGVKVFDRINFMVIKMKKHRTVN